jgi:hypothetical protein
VHTLLLAGVIVGIFFSSAITVLISLVDFDRLGGVVHWLLGNLGPIAPASLGVFGALTLIGLWLVVGQARPLNLLALGEESAQQLGVDAERVKRRVFAGAALRPRRWFLRGSYRLRGTDRAQVIRMLVGPDNRVVIPAAVLGGSCLLLLADTIARNVVAPPELRSASSPRTAERRSSSTSSAPARPRPGHDGPARRVRARGLRLRCHHRSLRHPRSVVRGAAGRDLRRHRPERIGQDDAGPPAVQGGGASSASSASTAPT